MPYTHTNSKGKKYILHGKDVTLRNGRQQRLYYFGHEAKPGETLDAVPDGYKVEENTRTGLPFLKKA
jgi:hypothetical protein